jgi:hypothetical protein
MGPRAATRGDGLNAQRDGLDAPAGIEGLVGLAQQAVGA